MDMTNQDYGKLVNQYSQSSPLGKNMVWAFLVGGAICTAGQGLSNLYQNWGMDQDAAGGAVSITLILAGGRLAANRAKPSRTRCATSDTSWRNHEYRNKHHIHHFG